MIEKLGICMEGNEPYFLAYLRRQLAQWSNGTYLEVGVAAGQTFAPVVREIQASSNRSWWKALAIDVPAGWSFNQAMIREAVPGIEVAETTQQVTSLGSLDGVADVGLVVHPRGVHGVDLMSWPAVRFALIDGCHGAPCVKLDFLYVERFTVPGSIVAFHDVNKECQGIHMQPHCKTGIDVRRALVDLGLLAGTRKGWRLLHEVTGVAHACVFFERI